MSKRKEVELTHPDGWSTTWRSSTHDKSCVEVDVFKDGHKVLEWCYGKTAGNSLIGNASFWADQVLLQARCEVRDQKEKCTPRMVYESREALVQSVATQMPDEYPSGMAAVLADEMIRDGKVRIAQEGSSSPPTCLPPPGAVQ